MSTIQEITQVSAFFFEVLVKHFLELEKSVSKQSGVLSIFKKINYLERADAFKGLKERAIEAKNSIPFEDELKGYYDGYSLAVKLTECLAIYINMVETQENINLYLNQKANGEKYSWNEYTKSIKFFDLQRNALESELPKLNSLYSVVLKNNNNETESAATKERINEKELAEYVVSMYLSELESNFDNIYASLIDLGLNECDLKDKNWMKYDIFLCGLTIDGMALFNLLDKSQANRIFEYISVEKFMGLDNEYQRDYSIDQISKYKNIWNNSIKQSEIPLDYVFSKLYKDLLGENLEKYNISPLHMMHIMSVVMPIFAGKWKNALEFYEPTID